MCNGSNLAYEKKAFEEVGGYRGNEKYLSGDDQFLLWKIKHRFGSSRITFLWDSQAIVSSDAETSFRGFINQRFRWVSKSRGYKDKLLIVMGIITYLFQALILAGIPGGFIDSVFFWLSLTFFVTKLMVDFPVVWIMAGFFEKRSLWPLFIPAQVFQVLYVVLSAPLAFLIPATWKGRRV